MACAFIVTSAFDNPYRFHLSSPLKSAVTLELVSGIVMKLPLLSYKSFVLFYYYDMAIADIAKQLEISENNMKNRLWRAIAQHKLSKSACLVCMECVRKCPQNTIRYQ